MNRILAILAVIPLTPLMYWVGLGTIVYFSSLIAGSPYVESQLAPIASIFYALFITLIFKKNELYHASVWGIALIWNAYLLKNEILGQLGNDDWFWVFRYAAVWITALSISFFLLQAFKIARSKSFIQKYRMALQQFRATGRNHRP